MSSVKVFNQKISLPKIGGGGGKPGTKSFKAPQQAASSARQKASQAFSQVSSRANQNQDKLWLPNTQRPDWLDGSLPGDRGFDPLGLAKPQEYLQVDLDQNDISSPSNAKGQVIGAYKALTQEENTGSTLVPYGEVFSLKRFRESEVIHGRWTMLATAGVLFGENATGVSWVDAGKVELEQPQYLGAKIPLTMTQLVIIEVLLVGSTELFRSRSTDPEERVYPGGWFDPLKLASRDPERAYRLKTAEIKHGRLSMIAFLGMAVQAFSVGEGATGSLAKFFSD